jgi:membrane protein implicated in regulation of membrane protease activity
MTMKPTDLRTHSSQTRKRLVAGGLILMIIAGAGLIAVTYGTPAAACGLGVFLVALVPVAIISLFLLFLQWIVSRMERGSEKLDAGRDEKP